VPDHVGEGLRHPGQHLGVVVAEVVAPAERVVDAAAVVAGDGALEVALVAAEQGDVEASLQQSCPVRTPLAGIPARWNMKASVPSAENRAAT
jgi:hypothetical protein